MVAINSEINKAVSKLDPHLIGVDWGSTCLRVFLIGTHGEVLATRTSAQGSSSMNGSAWAYEQSLEQLAGDWLQEYPDIKVLACGMVGSKHGWLEVPYVACPSDVSAIAARVMSVKGVDQRRFDIVPGMAYRPANGVPDVMRGEETQIAGVLSLRPEASQRSCIILPGTHSKWVQIEQGKVTALATHMTGELFAILRQHSVLGRLMPSQQNELDPIAFLRGVEDARQGMYLGFAHQLFAVRTFGLMEMMPPSSLLDYLSGLLIGHEIQAGLGWRLAAGLEQEPLILVGDPGLCSHYAQALSHCGVHNASILSNTAPTGLSAIARAIDLANAASVVSPSTRAERKVTT